MTDFCQLVVRFNPSKLSIMTENWYKINRLLSTRCPKQGVLIDGPVDKFLSSFNQLGHNFSCSINNQQINDFQEIFPSGRRPCPFARAMALVAIASMTIDNRFYINPKNLRILLCKFSLSLLGQTILICCSPSASIKPCLEHFNY